MKIWGVQEVAQTWEHLETKHFLNKADTNLNFPNVFYFHPIIPVQNHHLCWIAQKQKLNHLATTLNLFKLP